ncbi:cation efflux system protein CzcD homolog (plasmid) [Calothrix sp. NIES-4071]|nr:cation efflux system protein CzcD homolog [Calothrix sp. NIES-4071]BAZ64479.1 cation efflux system protein CzcD homolog [Calothrix sp. NIES-4105]
MAHSHNHGHHHRHNHGSVNYNRAFIVSIALNTGFVIYGVITNSLALLADAGHNLSNVLGLLLAWGASIVARRGPTPLKLTIF